MRIPRRHGATDKQLTGFYSRKPHDVKGYCFNHFNRFNPLPFVCRRGENPRDYLANLRREPNTLSLVDAGVAVA